MPTGVYIRTEEHRKRRIENLIKYNQSPEGREKHREQMIKYNQSPEGRERYREHLLKYNQSPEGREKRKNYNQSPEGSELHRKLGEANCKYIIKYIQSTEGRETRREQIIKRNQSLCMREIACKLKSEETRKKMSDAAKGEKNHNWKGGTTPLRDAIRGLPEARHWFFTCIKRDAYKDAYTDDTGWIEVHHKIPYFQIIAENNIKSIEEAKLCPALWDINNGITLLKQHHRFLHNKYGYVIFTDEMYKDCGWRTTSKIIQHGIFSGF